jgi:hypothetical protein
MKNINLISTDKPSRLYLHSNNELQLRTNIIRTSEDYLGTNQNIYITNSEEIKEGDWCYDKVLNLIFQTDNHTDFKYANQTDNVLKIILTTDQDLIKDGVQSIDDEFLEWFVKNPSCESVEIQCRYNFYAGQDLTHYKIIIPQEEPKQETEQINVGGGSGSLPMYDVEELNEIIKLFNDKEIDLYTCIGRVWNKAYFIGAKEMAERMYSEEDVMNALHSVELKYNKDFTKIYEGMKEWFEQNKKK